jgi:hypothetical protein
MTCVSFRLGSVPYISCLTFKWEERRTWVSARHVYTIYPILQMVVNQVGTAGELLWHADDIDAEAMFVD